MYVCTCVYTHIYTYTYNVTLFCNKKEWNIVICNTIGRPGDYYTKWNKSDNNKYHMSSLLCGILKNKAKKQNWNGLVENQLAVAKQEEVGKWANRWRGLRVTHPKSRHTAQHAFLFFFSKRQNPNKGMGNIISIISILEETLL